GGLRWRGRNAGLFDGGAAAHKAGKLDVAQELWWGGGLQRRRGAGLGLVHAGIERVEVGPCGACRVEEDKVLAAGLSRDGRDGLHDLDDAARPAGDVAPLRRIAVKVGLGEGA